MLKALGSCIVLAVLVAFPQTTTAAYFLPYPSYMPGHKLYRVSRLIDAAKRYWYWGNLASYRYYLEQSDKALVEAKTLFEYRQYLFAIQALDRSNHAIVRVTLPLKRAKEEGKDIGKYVQEFRRAIDEHERLIADLKRKTPVQFMWTPEKDPPQELAIHQALKEAERVRNEALTNLP